MAATAFESGIYVALVGAVFSAAVAVGGELRPTAGADKSIDRPLVDLFGMPVPPLDPAFFATKDTGLCASRLWKPLPALAAFFRCDFFCHCPRQAIPAAEALDRFFRDAQAVCNGCVSRTFMAEGCDPLFLFVRHRTTSTYRPREAEN